MKMLVVSPHLQSFVRDQVKALSAHGTQAEVLLLRPRWSLLDNQRSSRIGFGRELPNRQYVVRSILLSTRWPVPLSDKSHALAAARRIVRRGSFDILHGHFLYPSGAISVQVAHEEGIPSVVTAHGFDVYALPFRNPSWRRKIVEILALCSAVITVSRRNAAILQTLGVPTDVIKVIPNGYDPGIFFPGSRPDARRRLGLREDVPIALAVGHLVGVKGFDVAVRAVALLGGRIRLIVLGRGPMQRHLADLARKLGIPDRVSFCGEVPHSQVPDYMQACDLVVISSHIEGNPTVLFEALGCGRPVVATAVGGIPEILTPRQGVLVEPGSEEALTSGITQALGQDWSPAEIAASAEPWAWPNIANRLVRVYDEVRETVRGAAAS